MSEQFVVSIINHVPQSDKIALDVGANHGIYTTMLAQKFKKVFAFEPQPDNIEILQKNIQQFNNVEIVAKAISDKSGSVKLNINPHNMGGHSISKKVAAHPEWGFTQQITMDVPAITLDEFCADKDVGFIKFDIEGAEDFIFTGAQETLKRPDLNILIEVHNEVNLKNLYDMFKSHNFRIFGLGLSFGPGTSHYETVLVNDFVADNHYFLIK